MGAVSGQNLATKSAVELIADTSSMRLANRQSPNAGTVFAAATPFFSFEDEYFGARHV
jgi:hypothetical protein